MNEAVMAELQPMVPARQAAPSLTRRERFLRAAACLPVDHPPVWLMRQAGRALPEYRKLKERFTFLELAQTPQLAAEVTLQPIRRFGFDAAIIFSDILVIPEAMGVGYRFRETGGVEMNYKIQSAADIEKLSTSNIADKLGYVTEAIRLVREELQGDTALLGFVGSPWTLANFMLDGGSAKKHTAALQLFREDRRNFEALCDKLSAVAIEFLHAQIRAGVDAVQIFDSLGGLIPEPDFQAASAVWMREIIAGIGNRIPTIVFSKGSRDWPSIVGTDADVIGVDHGISLAEVRRQFPERPCLQGNLTPDCLTEESPEQVALRVEHILGEMRGRNGFIFNLGHGLPPNAQLENIQAILQTIREAE